VQRAYIYIIGDEGAKALAQNSSLTTLNLYNNGIGDEGAKALAQNSSLTTLNLEYNGIGAEGAKALAQNSSLTTLNLYNNGIGDETLRLVNSALDRNRQLLSSDLEESPRNGTNGSYPTPGTQDFLEAEKKFPAEVACCWCSPPTCLTF
jgi:hypothetical protein